MAPTVTERDCDLRHKPLETALDNWDKRWDKIVFAIIGVLFLMVCNLGVSLYKTDRPSTVSQVQAQPQPPSLK